MEINIRILTEELAEGQTVSQYIVEKLGGAVVTTAEPPNAERLADLQQEVEDHLAEIDTSEEDDALDAATLTPGPVDVAPTGAVVVPEVPAPVLADIAPSPAAAAPAVVLTPEAPIDPAVQAPDTTYIAGVEIDIAGVPWSAELHSSNKKQYGKGSGGAKAGRWQWKRGTDEATREGTAAQLAADLKSAAQPTVPAAAPVAAPAVQAAPAAAVAAPVAAVPVAENVAPPATVAAPVAAPVVGSVVNSTPPVAAPAAVSPAGWTWPFFLEAMTATGTTAEAVLGIAAQHGVTTIQELSPRVDVLEAVATALAWPVPVAA
tara:strand:- start:1887 stop:2840 length:954 start_codon:yes stop_codon:yes gene_type:complete